MSKFITVLNSDLGKDYWKAIQWDNSIGSIRSNKYYTAGVNLNLLKTDYDNLLEEKIVIETATYMEGRATIIEIAPKTKIALELAENKVLISQLKNTDR